MLVPRHFHRLHYLCKDKWGVFDAAGNTFCVFCFVHWYQLCILNDVMIFQPKQIVFTHHFHRLHYLCEENLVQLELHSVSLALLAPTGALVLMMVYYIYIYISKATFPDFHSVPWCNWCYKCHSKLLKQYHCNWCHVISWGYLWDIFGISWGYL